jgi:hypothetical protein
MIGRPAAGIHLFHELADGGDVLGLEAEKF